MLYNILVDFRQYLVYKIKYYFICFDINYFLQKDIKDQYLYFKKNNYEKFNCIIDIGANIGLWSLAFKTIFKNANFYLIEPNKNHNQILKNVSKNIYNYVLYSKAKYINFYHTDEFNGTGNSIYKEKSNIFFKKIKIKTNTLDNFFYKKLKKKKIDLIKIDTQGSELEILKGARECLKINDRIIIEISDTNYNFKKNLKKEIFEFLKKKNFSKIEVLSKSGLGKTRHTDYLFIKE